MHPYIFYVPIFLVVGFISNVSAQSVWNIRSPGGVFNSVVKAPGGDYIAVGERGLLLRSADGTLWSQIRCETFNRFNEVIFENNQYLAVGDGGLIMTSPDGLSWTQRNPPGRSNILAAAVWTGTEFVVTSYNGSTVMTITSTDGITWTSHSVNTADWLCDIAYTGSRLVAVGSTNKVITSQDGTEWTEGVVDIDSIRLRTLCWTGSEMVMFGVYDTQTTVFISPDGITWTRQPTKMAGLFMSVAWTGTELVAVGDDGKIAVSSTGETWTYVQSGTTELLRRVITTDQGLLAISGTRILSSTDAQTWTTHMAGCPNHLYGIGKAGGKLYAVGNRRIVTSVDGRLWAWVTAEVNQDLYAVAGNDSQVVAVGPNGLIMTCSDGTNWVRPVSGTRATLRSVVHTANGYVIVGDSGRVLTSTDGIEWIHVTSGTIKPLTAVVWNGSRYIAVGRDTYITSPDGILWDGTFKGTTCNLLSITWNGDYAVAAGSRGTIMTSPDGTVWTGRTSMTTDSLRAIATGMRSIAAAGDSGIICTSVDAKVWRSFRSGTTGSINSVIWNDLVADSGEFLAVGYGGLIMSSAEDPPTSIPTEYIPATPRSSRKNVGSQIIVDAAGRMHRTSPAAVGLRLNARTGEPLPLNVKRSRQ
jgi:hypothetical protein